MQEKRLTPPERELEAALGSLSPAAPTLDRDRLMFRAGQASTRRRARAWQGLAAALAVTTTVSIVLRPAPSAVRPTFVPGSGQTGSGGSFLANAPEPLTRHARLAAAGTYFRQRQALLSGEEEAAMPTSAPSTGAADALPRLPTRLLDRSRFLEL